MYPDHQQIAQFSSLVISEQTELSYNLNMSKIKEYPSSIGLLGDIVASRHSDRKAAHASLLSAIEETNTRVCALHPLRVTVGDEFQGVYRSLGDALNASYELRNLLYPGLDIRFGLGGGDIQIIDETLGIQDGSGWHLAREAIEEAWRLGNSAATAGIRTSIRDERGIANGLAEASAQLIDACLYALGDGPRRSLRAIYDGLDNQSSAKLLGVSPSANSQRVITNNLRPLARLMKEMTKLP